jgi:uncharacterized protein YxeA
MPVKIICTKIVLFVVCLMLLIPALASAQIPPTGGEIRNLRSSLGKILGEHALLAEIAMQKKYDGAADAKQAADTLQKNTYDLTTAIASIYGEEAGQKFETIWSSHIQYLEDYVNATAAKDDAGRTKAYAALDSYRVYQASFFADANPNLKQTDIEAGLAMHITDLLDAFNAYVKKDYTSAYKHIRESYVQMYATGDILATAIAKQFNDKYLQTTFDASSDLRSKLESLLGEHAILAVLSMQKGIAGSADYDQASAAWMQNSDDLAAAIASIYGKEAGASFLTIWNSQIGFFADYAKATAAKDETKRQSAVANLEDYRLKQKEYFANGLSEHIGHLLDASHAYAEGNYTEAYSDLRTAHAHMISTGEELANGIMMQFPEKFGAIDPTPVPAKKRLIFKVNSTEFNNNGKHVTMDTMPTLENGVAYIPVRYVGEAIGVKVTWDGKDRSAMVISVNGKDTVMWLNNNMAQVDGISKDMGGIAHLSAERAVVPADFLAEVFGWSYQWDEMNQTIMLMQK